MESRENKYYSDDFVDSSSVSTSRSSRNARLYRQVYGRYSDLDNLPLDDNTDEIDMDRLRELVSNSNSSNNKKSYDDYNLNILETRKRDIDNQKIYDINKLLEKAKYENNKLMEPVNTIKKSSRSLLSTLESNDLSVDEIKKACRKYEDFDNSSLDNNDSNNNITEDMPKKEDVFFNADVTNKIDNLEMTRELKYQTKQISVDPLIEQVVPDNDLSLDLFSDLKPTGDTIVTKPIVDNDIDNKKDEIPANNVGTNTSNKFFDTSNISNDIHSSDTRDIDVIKKSNGVDTDFFTSSYQFSKKDFTSEEDDDGVEYSSHNGIKIFLLILAIFVFVGVIFYFVLNYGMGV